MDSLYWKQLVPNISVVFTRKLFYKKYLYRLELTAYGSQCINATTDIDESLRLRNLTYREINYGGSWKARMREQIKRADPEWLNYLKKFKQTVSFDCNIRVEEPKVQIYSNSPSDLENFIKQIPGDYVKYISGISIPKNDQELSLLQAGKLIVKKDPKYPYKIIFRDGKYDLDTKNHIINYLDSLDDIVRVPEHCRSMLLKSYSGIWECYVYSKDSDIVTFLQLIDPKLIRSIIEMATIEDINNTIIQGSPNGQDT